MCMLTPRPPSPKPTQPVMERAPAITAEPSANRCVRPVRVLSALRSRFSGFSGGNRLHAITPHGEAGLPRAGPPQPIPPAARAAGHTERFVRVAHSSQPGAADSFCAPTAGDAVLPLS